jgi:ribonuclease R
MPSPDRRPRRSSSKTRSQSRTPAKPSSGDLQKRILAILQAPDYQPLDKVELSKALDIPSDRRAELRSTLQVMEQDGSVARIRKNRFILPEEADLLTGVIQIHRTGGAHLLSGKRGEPDLYISSDNTGTAMNGDTVVVRLVHEGARQRQAAARGQRQEGRVIRILKRKSETIVGTLQRSKKFHYVIPDDPHIAHDIYVEAGGENLPRPPRIGDKVVVRLLAWESRHVNPEGEILEVLGPASAPGVDLLSIIRKYHLPTDFPDAVLAEAEAIQERIDEGEIATREDLRDSFILTIDPDDAKDFDDAVHVERTSDGWTLGVHIADVSHYVKPGTALDREAYERGNSVYLVDRVIPMLPEQLSNGICSLRPEVDRLTRSVFIQFSRNGKIQSARFAHTVIHSKARLTYKKAFALLQGRPDTPLAERLHIAWELASLLRMNRFKAGSLDLDFPEIKVRLDEEGKPIRLERVENDISHQLIEEFMLAANEVVARETKNRLFPAIYRIHEDPDPDRLGEFRELAMGYGFKPGDLTQRGEVQKLLRQFDGHPAAYALKLGFLKSLKRATYDPSPLGHYGLAKPNYTHFTSPIRRYADLVVHRSIALATKGAKGRNSPKIASTDLPSCSDHISDTERNAADAEKESVQLKKLEYFQNQLSTKKPDAFHAVIVDVKSFGLLVELPQFLLTGLIHVSSLNDDFYHFDPARLRFTGRQSKKSYQIGDQIEVMVARVDMFKRQIDFFPAVKGGTQKEAGRRKKEE